jgi:hypothetical protein
MFFIANYPAVLAKLRTRPAKPATQPNPELPHFNPAIRLCQSDSHAVYTVTQRRTHNFSVRTQYSNAKSLKPCTNNPKDWELPSNHDPDGRLLGPDERWQSLVATFQSFHCCHYAGSTVHRIVDDRSSMPITPAG